MNVAGTGEIIDVRKLEGKTIEALGVEVRMSVVRRVLAALERFHVFVHNNNLQDILRPEGAWNPLTVFLESNTSLCWSSKDNTTPDAAHQVMIEVVSPKRVTPYISPTYFLE